MTCDSATSRLRHKRRKIFMSAHKVPGARVPDVGEADTQEVLKSYAIE